MRINVQVPGFKELAKTLKDEAAAAATATMDEVTQGLTRDLRAQVQAAGLGSGVANAWRGERYPAGQKSISPAAYVFSKAPKIIDAFSKDTVIRTVNGKRYLAIPTENVPYKGGRQGRPRRMTPEEVEDSFNQDLKFARTSKGAVIAFVSVIGAKSGRGFRPPTKGRLAQGRGVEDVVMFFLVPQVTLRQRLDLDAVANKWADAIAGLLDKNWK